MLTDFEYKGDYLCAGWLHDVGEDTSTTLDEIERSFGSEVARLVDAVSGGGDRAKHLASIYKKIAAHPDAAVLKLADRIANVEACARGDKHAERYAGEHDGFAAAIQPHVYSAEMWQRYERALGSRRGKAGLPMPLSYALRSTAARAASQARAFYRGDRRFDHFAFDLLGLFVVPAAFLNPGETLTCTITNDDGVHQR